MMGENRPTVPGPSAHRRGQLRLVRSPDGPVVALIAAAERWANAESAEPRIAYIEIGDGEIAANVGLTAPQVAELTVFLADRCGRRAGMAPARIEDGP